LAGGASVMSINDTFNIGRRNIQMVRTLLKGFGLKIIAEDVEGTISRTVTALVSTGEVILSSPGRPDWKL
jgi:chemotaxis protein CheD